MARRESGSGRPSQREGLSIPHAAYPSLFLLSVRSACLSGYLHFRLFLSTVTTSRTDIEGLTVKGTAFHNRDCPAKINFNL